jgi:cytochrome c-type biogenesis protein CcmH/NrfG
MNQDVSSPLEPDPHRLTSESLAEQLRALPLAPVPDGLPAQLAAAIPPATTVGTPGSRVPRHWPWIAAVGVVCITTSAVVGSWWMHVNSKPPAAPNENGHPSTIENQPPTSSKSIRDLEQAVSVDPYNADAWFSLAKAQAEVHRSADAISSAQKAIDVGRSRNRTAFVDLVEAWVRSYRASESGRPPP